MSDKNKQLLDEQFLEEGFKYLKRQEMQVKLNQWSEGLDPNADSENEITPNLLTDDFIEEGLIYLERKEMRGKLEEWQEKAEDSNKLIIKRMTSYRTFMRIAAGLLVLVVSVIVWRLTTNNVPTRQEVIFEEYFSVYTTRSRGIEDKAVKNQAFDALENKKYGKASKLFIDLYENERDTASLFWSGVADLGASNIDESFEKLNQYKDIAPINADEANWYIALGYVYKADTIALSQKVEELEVEFLKFRLQQIINQFKSQ